MDEHEGASSINIDRAKANGLTFRPLAQTAADVLEWWYSATVSDDRRRSLLEDDIAMMRRETEIIAAWKARG